MKRILFLLLVALGFVGQAQITHTDKGDVDQNAEKILKQAAAKINGSAVSFDVTMVSRDANKKEQNRQSAKVLYNKGKYRVVAGDNILYSNNANTWHWDKLANECTLTKASTDNTDLMNPAGLLTNYSKNFRAKYIRLENDGTAVIDLTPKKGRSFHKIRILVNTKTNVLKSLTLHNYDSSSSEYQVTNFKSGVATTDGDFVFPSAKNPKVEIIDMR